ncbi:putative transposable element [Trichonephila clavipes]|nr:putative transposable element [Trichonephila clavipes]
MSYMVDLQWVILRFFDGRRKLEHPVAKLLVIAAIVGFSDTWSAAEEERRVMEAEESIHCILNRLWYPGVEIDHFFNSIFHTVVYGQIDSCGKELWFQQDGATCHTARATIDLLKDTLGDRLISRFGSVNWPPRSCDLSPLDYFLWGYVKSLVYADKPQTLDHLEDNIRRVIGDIRPQMLEKVIENWTSRLDYIRASRGSPMPEIIFKIHGKLSSSGRDTTSFKINCLLWTKRDTCIEAIVVLRFTGEFKTEAYEPTELLLAWKKQFAKGGKKGKEIIGGCLPQRKSSDFPKRDVCLIRRKPTSVLNMDSGSEIILSIILGTKGLYTVSART